MERQLRDGGAMVARLEEQLQQHEESAKEKKVRLLMRY